MLLFLLINLDSKCLDFHVWQIMMFCWRLLWLHSPIDVFYYLIQLVIHCYPPMVKERLRERERGPAVREEEINWLPLLTHATSFHYNVKVRDLKYFNSSFYKELPLFILVMHLLIPIFISSRKPSNENFYLLLIIYKRWKKQSL